jgi:very-short-patch-repair endonuclease
MKVDLGKPSKSLKSLKTKRQTPIKRKLREFALSKVIRSLTET